MFSFSLSNIALLIVAPLAAYFGSRFLLGRDRNKEERRRGAAQLAATLQGYGLKHTPDILIDYSVGDYSAMAQKMTMLAKVFLNGEAAVLDEFGKVFDRVLEAKLRTKEGVAALKQRVAEAEQGMKNDASA